MEDEQDHDERSLLRRKKTRRASKYVAARSAAATSTKTTVTAMTTNVFSTAQTRLDGILATTQCEYCTAASAPSSAAFPASPYLSEGHTRSLCNRS